MKLQQSRKPLDLKCNYRQATAPQGLLALRKRLKPQTAATQSQLAKHSKNFWKRIRAVRCYSDASEPRTEQTILLAHSVSIAKLPRFNRTHPNMHSVTVQPWFRRVAFPKQRTSCNK